MITVLAITFFTIIVGARVLFYMPVRRAMMNTMYGEYDGVGIFMLNLVYGIFVLLVITAYAIAFYIASSL
jgi:hypothetical protein